MMRVFNFVRTTMICMRLTLNWSAYLTLTSRLIEEAEQAQEEKAEKDRGQQGDQSQPRLLNLRELQSSQRQRRLYHLLRPWEMCQMQESIVIQRLRPTVIS